MKSEVLKNGLLTIMLLLALVAVQACGEKKNPQSKAATTSKADVKKEVKEAYDATKAYTQEQMGAFQQEAETKLAEYKKGIDQLQSKAENLEGDAKAKAEQQLTALRQKRDALSEKLTDLSSSGANAWEQIKSGVDAALEDLEDAYQKAAAEFGQSQP